MTRKKITIKERLIESDILILIEQLTKIKWMPVNLLSLNRIIYFTLLTNEYIYPSDSSIFKFSEDNCMPFYYYTFKSDHSGPISSELNSIFDKLLNTKVIRLLDDSIKLSREMPLNNYPFYNEKSKKFKTISELLVFYGEFEIYDLIFKDITFSNTYNRNSDIIIFENNRTLQLLIDLKKQFDENIEHNSLDEYNYLKMYFDFAFKEISREKGAEQNE